MGSRRDWRLKFSDWKPKLHNGHGHRLGRMSDDPSSSPATVTEADVGKQLIRTLAADGSNRRSYLPVSAHHRAFITAQIS